MKKVLSVIALTLACMLLFAACNKEQPNTQTSTTPAAPQQTTETKQEEPKPAEEPKADPKEEYLEKAKEDKEAVLAVVKMVVDNYRSGNVPDYYEGYPSKEAYPPLESVDELTLEKGDGGGDIYVFTPVGNQQMCVSMKYVGGDNPWMVIAVGFAGVKG